MRCQILCRNSAVKGFKGERRSSFIHMKILIRLSLRKRDKFGGDEELAKVVEGIADVEMALSMHSAAGASITAGGWGCRGSKGVGCSGSKGTTYTKS